MVVTPSGIVIEGRFSQFWNVYFAIRLILVDSEIEVKLLHPPNAATPMLVTELGMVTLIRSLQLKYLQITLYQLFAN